MLFYLIELKYARQTGEDNPGAVKETYLVEGMYPADVQERTIEHIKPYVFGDLEVPSCKKVQFFEIVENADTLNLYDWNYYKAKVEMITIDGDKETRKAVNILVKASDINQALTNLNEMLKEYDCEVVSIAKSPIVELIRGAE